MSDVGDAAVLDVGMSDAGANEEIVAIARDRTKFGKAGDIDDERRLDQTPSASLTPAGRA
jgi:hypothetical protein